MTSVLRVGVPVPVPQVFDYLPPPGRAPEPCVGHRVRVPFGRRELVGVVLGEHTADADPRQLRTALAWLADTPPLPDELLRTLTWAASYYAYPLGEALAAAWPVALREGRAAARAVLAEITVSSAGRDALSRNEPRPGSRLRALLEWLAQAPRSLPDIEHWHEGAQATLRTLRQRGLVEAHTPMEPRSDPAATAAARGWNTPSFSQNA